MRRSLRSLWLVIATSFKVSPRQSVLCLLEAAGKILLALNPLWFGMFTAGVVEQRVSLAVWSIVGLVGSVGLATTLSVIGMVASLRLSTEVAFAFDIQVTGMSGSIPTLDHMEDPKLLNKLQLLRDNDGALSQALNGFIVTLNNLAWATTSIFVALVADWRLILLAIFGLPRLVALRWTLSWDRVAEEEGGPASRLAHSLLGLTADVSAGAETRVFGLQQEMRQQIRAAVRAWRAPLITKSYRYGALNSLTGAFYFAASAAIIGWIAHDALQRDISPSVLVISLSVIGAMQQVSQVLIHGMQLFSGAVRNANRFIWMKDYARVAIGDPSGQMQLRPPARLRDGVRLESLTYRYPGADRDSLTDVTLHMPAGSVVAIVGENGAGKSTLVKLLGGMYQPSAGHILVDGVDLFKIDLEAWRSRITGAFQDYATFEFSVRESVGVGDLRHIDDVERVRRALRDGFAEDIVTALPRGLQTQLGTSWLDGVELSGGQWQRLAIGRAMMRSSPLLLVLDEPTSALDAATEHALFDRYAAAARVAGQTGAVTLIVTHRFSTVSAADLVVVLDHGRIAEQGTHAELMAAGGRYAQLYELQARGYR